MSDRHVYTPADDDRIRAGRAANEGSTSIALAIGVTKNSIISRARTLGLARLKSPFESAPLQLDFDRIFRLREVQEKPWGEIGEIVGHLGEYVSKWYRAQCDERGVERVTRRVAPPRTATVFTFRRDPEIDSTPLPAPIPGGTLYEFMDRGCCQWMLNDAWPWRACGLPQRRGVYCVAHHADAYPPRKGREAA
jgi:hypothetical protein